MAAMKKSSGGERPGKITGSKSNELITDMKKKDKTPVLRWYYETNTGPTVKH
jgi:hypothetical protein